MEDVGEWCRENLSGSAVEVHSLGPAGVTVTLPYELTSISTIVRELTDKFDVDVDYCTTDMGGELKIFWDNGIALPKPAAPLIAGKPGFWRCGTSGLCVHLLWAGMAITCMWIQKIAISATVVNATNHL